MKSAHNTFLDALVTIVGVAILFFAGQAHAWRVETQKEFSGQVNTYWVATNANGAELVYDLQQNWVFFTHKGHVLDGVRGIKIDGQYFAKFGKSESSTKFQSAVFLHANYEPNTEILELLKNAKKVEINVKYFSNNNPTVVGFVTNK